MEMLGNLSLTEILCIGVNVLIIGFFAFKILKRGGVTPALYDARIQTTIGVIEATQAGAEWVKFKVQTLERDGAALIGVTWLAYADGGWVIKALNMTQAQARALRATLLAAVQAMGAQTRFDEAEVQAMQGAGRRLRIRVSLRRDPTPCIELECAMRLWRWHLPLVRSALTSRQVRELVAALEKAVEPARLTPPSGRP